METGNIGNSELGQQIPYIFVGKKNGNYMIVQGAIHAREHLTALLVVNLAKHLVKNPQLSLLGGIYFVPMVNPDGVRLCQEGVGFVGDKQRKSNLLAINGNSDFSLWKANVEGVDLNVNFDARWGEGAEIVAKLRRKISFFCQGNEGACGIYLQNQTLRYPFLPPERRGNLLGVRSDVAPPLP